MATVKETPFSGPAALSGRQFLLTAENTSTSVFFALPDTQRSLLSNAPEAILPYAAVFALVHGEDLDCAGMSVDSLLLRNTRCALAELVYNRSDFRAPQILNATEVQKAFDSVGDAGVFFSGGIDSFFSLLRHRAESDCRANPNIGPVSHAIHVYHTAKPISEEVPKTLSALANTVEELGLNFIPIQSNYMIADRLVNDHWADLAHGAGLASVLHLLSGGLRQGLISSTHTWGARVPWGSGPITDPLWSGGQMQIVHDDSAYDRVEKTELIAKHPGAMAHLNVCDTRVDGHGYVNCSSCPKCLRTMLTLDLFGKNNGSAAPAFNWSDYSPGAFTRVFLRTDSDLVFARAIRDRAQIEGRNDIVSACDVTLRRGRMLRPVAKIEESVKNSYAGRRFRGSLIALRKTLYRSAGLATKR